MVDVLSRVGRVAVPAVLALAFVLAASIALSAERAKTPSLWFDPTQLPSFSGAVDRFLSNPDGGIDRLVFKEGPQIIFPPDAFEAVRDALANGRHLVVWGIRARQGPVITMLAFAPPGARPTILDRFYWRPEGAESKARRDMVLIGTVAAPYLSPQGHVAGAILENGDVIRVDPKVAAGFKDRFAGGSKLVAAGPGVETPHGKAIDADRIGESVETLERLPTAEPTQPGPQSAR